MRTALPAPAFLREARERRREIIPNCSPLPRQVPYHFVVGRSGLVDLKAQWLARHLAENPGARVSIISASERGADQLIQATKRAWNQQSLGDRLLEHFRDAPPDPEAQAYIDAHAVDDIAPPTIEQRLADVSDGIWRRMIQRIERGW